MNRIRPSQALCRRIFLSAITTLLLAAVGCGGGGMSLITLGTASSENLDAGQSVTVTATIVNDTGHKGASFSLTGPGTLGSPTLTTASGNSIVTLSYTAPSSVSAATTATITATSSNTPAQKAVLTINLYPALSLPTTTLPSGQVGVAYGPVTLASSGGTGTTTWTLASGSLPAGITLNAKTGVLSGSPTAYGTFNFSVSAIDTSVSPTAATQSYSLAILATAPTVTTTSLPAAAAGAAYSQQLTYSGGNTSTTVWAIVSGALPTGLTLNSTTGIISGTPANTTAGSTYSFQVTVTTGSQTSAPQSLSIFVPSLPTVSTTSLATGNIGIPYSQTLSYSGGNGSTSVSWAITSGSLPVGSGLSLNASTGVISGTPSAAATYNFSVTVTVGTQTSAPQALSLTVYSVNVTSAATATGEVGLPFNFQLTAAGGTPPYTWSLASGSNALPTGYTLNATTGVISATPTTTTGSPFTGIVVQATDSASATATKALTLSINPARSGSNTVLTGSYAFLLNGFDAGGNPLAAAGSFTTDGAGNITGGVMDINGTGMATPLAAATLQAATYSAGADGRGQLTLKTSTSSTTFVFSSDALSSGIAGGGYLSKFDGSGQTLTGTFAKQTSAVPTVASLNSGFAFGAGGFAAGSTASVLTHRSLAGELQFNQTATPASAEYLVSSANSIAPNVPSALSLSFTANGRGALSWKPETGGNTMDFALYVISPTQFFLISTDPTQGTTGVNDLFSGQALQQTTATFNAATLNGTSVVRYQSLGTTTSATQFADAALGLYTFNGSGTVSLAGDENAGGVSKSLVTSGSYIVASTGRVQATLPTSFGGCADCVGYGQVYFYLVGSNQGFLMDFSTEAKSGSFDPQTAGPTNSSVSGIYALGSLTPLAASATEDSAVLTAGGSGSATGTEDLNASGSLSPDTAFTATYSVSANGRSTFVPTPGDNSVLYIITPNKSVSLDLTSGSPVVTELTHQ